MSVDLKKARDFVYANGVLWERALFAYHFEDGSLEHLHRCLLAYKNADNGFGHAFEHDIRCPDSHPAALEFLLTLLVENEIPPGDLLEGTPQWLEQQQQEDGSLQNPAALLDYPHMPWWGEWGGQKQPGSIVGNLTKLGLATPKLAETTRRWVAQHLTLESIRNTEWLFMNYHAYDYFMNVDDYPDVEQYRQATIANIIACAEKAPAKQYYGLFRFAPSPDSAVAQAAQPGLIGRYLDHLEGTQQEDGGWRDEHGLAHWYPYVTISTLLALRRYGRLAEAL